jgi:crotonobetainyl-CoA:carnitine CoA-transferase CaiB-like acyl-CoA transferase
LCRKLGHPELVADQFAEGERQAAAIDTLRGTLASRPSAEWLDLFQDADVCVTLVRNVAEVAADPYLQSDVVLPRLSETPGWPGGSPPRLGEH